MIHHAKTGDKTINSRKEQQNQCLSKSSVGAPFSATETFKVLFSALNILAFFISLNISVSHAQSDCEAGEQNCWDCGKTENDLCTARLDTANKALSITGTGEMRDYSGHWYDHTKTPWGVDYTSVSVQGVKNIGAKAFEDTSLTSVNIGDTVKYIGSGAFDRNLGLTSVIIPDSVTGIDWAAFFNNTNLAKVFISESVTDIETFIHTDVDDNEKGPFDRNNSGSTLYCAESTPCYSYVDSNVVTYTKTQTACIKSAIITMLRLMICYKIKLAEAEIPFLKNVSVRLHNIRTKRQKIWLAVRYVQLRKDACCLLIWLTKKKYAKALLIVIIMLKITE